MKTNEEILKEAKMKGIIKVENYLYDGRISYGLPYENTDKWILDDGDIYSIQDLLDEDYKVIPITPLQIEQAERKRILELVEGYRNVCLDYKIIKELKNKIRQEEKQKCQDQDLKKQ
jgi:hypothetical protein